VSIVYMKAYPVEEFEKYPAWKPDQGVAEKYLTRVAETLSAEDEGREEQRITCYYLQEDLTVTAGTIAGEDVVFRDESAAWAKFCREHLKFEKPEFKPVPLRQEFVDAGIPQTPGSDPKTWPAELRELAERLMAEAKPD
jgi:hypothetical protein